MANPHFKELELSHSDFIRKDVVSFLSSAVMCFFTVAMRMRRIVNQKQSSKDSIPVYLYITTWCVRPWHFAPSTQKCSSFSQGKHFPGYFKTVMTRYMQHLRSQLFSLKPIPWKSVQTSVRNLTTTTALGTGPSIPNTCGFLQFRESQHGTVWPAVDNCGRQRYTYFWIFSSLLPNLKLEIILKTSGLSCGVL